MQIRIAIPADADAATDVLRRSIRDLCIADHQGDPEILKHWLANKQPDVFRGWLLDADAPVLVVVDDGRVLAVGGVRRPDEVLLNYVAPEARFRGISKALLADMERRLRGFGAREARLTSTKTAQTFYRSAGYSGAGDVQKHGMDCLDMTKRLEP